VAAEPGTTESPNGLTLVVTLHAHAGQEAGLRAYEKQAMAVLREHGGRLEKVIRVEASLDAGPVPHEVHVVWFPTEAHFASYRNDPRLADLAPLRAQAIKATSVLVGREADTYDNS
jgi:uncharacterized protein (DUF1330 family)